MKKTYVSRICRVLLCLMLVFCVLAGEGAPAQAVTQAEIDALKDDASDLKSKRKELESKLSALSDDKAEVLKRKNLLLNNGGRFCFWPCGGIGRRA